RELNVLGRADRNNQAETGGNRHAVTGVVRTLTDLADSRTEGLTRDRSVDRDGLARDRVNTLLELRRGRDTLAQSTRADVLVRLQAHAEHVGREAVDEAERVVHTTLQRPTHLETALLDRERGVNLGVAKGVLVGVQLGNLRGHALALVVL